MKDFFISYNHNDEKWAKWIAKQLEKAGYTSVYQKRDFPLGCNFLHKIQKALTETRCTIAVISRNYFKSKFATDEWTAVFAQHQEKLIPVRIEKCEPEGLLAPLVKIDLFGKSRKTARNDLLRGVETRVPKLEKNQRPESSSSNHSNERKKKYFLFGFIFVPIFFILVFLILTPSAIDTSKLLKAENELHVPFDTSMNAKYNEKIQYFFQTNIDFINHFNSIKEQAQQNVNHLGLTFFFGGPGAGKSFIFEKLKSSSNIAIYKRNLSCHIAKKNQLDTLNFEMKPDLKAEIGDFSFSSLANLKNPNTFDFKKFMKMANIPLNGNEPLVILIDGIDEIHPEFSELIIKETYDYIDSLEDSGNTQFLHIFFFGRPEGFKGFMTKYHRPDVFRRINRYAMKLPQIRTMGDLKIMVDSYQNGYNECGEKLPQTLNNLKKLVKQHDFVLYTMRYLSHNTFFMQQAASKNSIERTESELKASIFSALLRRNEITHGRPSSHNLRYSTLLQKIAKKYALEIDDKGFFEVKVFDMISIKEVDSNGKTQNLNFGVANTLDRSGLVYLHPPSFANPRYRFEPFWLHRYLIEQKRNPLQAQGN